MLCFRMTGIVLTLIFISYAIKNAPSTFFSKTTHFNGQNFTQKTY